MDSCGGRLTFSMVVRVRDLDADSLPDPTEIVPLHLRSKVVSVATFFNCKFAKHYRPPMHLLTTIY